MKKKFWKCAYYDYVNEDLTRMKICHNPNSGHYDCICEYAFQESSCPFYKKGDKSYTVNLNENELRMIEDFKEQMRTETNKRETGEQTLLKYLKQKYENV